ncbi:twin-arginine translocase TatA/TatE family subunit [Marinimicrobium sp. ABcell2]|uniref:twin-arginine translocase TatA/TatE family subunit n=1 Tax=Marinimicrobium sp. ABcell2 TaxID=3069751 RepID=UPI0027B4B93C|nr:twin-arginine translocase TatA/TatE family subunit [Marinimicrobium sp. ABcell2]MDQ2076485.1 twin-arginine translocase TatA/TatE family subunit [Marinimicrobium sp. ABcell2]
MGISGIGIWQLLIILAIVIMLFGTKRLRNIGTDLGSAIKGFKKSVSDEETEKSEDADTKSVEGGTDADVKSEAAEKEKNAQH